MPIRSAFGAGSIRGFSPGAKTIVDGMYSNVFNGSNYLSLASSTAFAPGSNWTIEFFIYTSAYPSVRSSLFCVGLSASVTGTFEIVITSTGSIEVRWSNGSTISILTTTNTVSLNSWTYIAVSGGWSSPNYGLRIWINGTQGASNSGYYFGRTGSTELFIGRTSVSSNFFTGSISNLRYITGSSIASASTPTSPLTNITGTKLLTCQSSTIKDNSTANAGGPWSITNNNSVTVSPTSPFYP